MPILQPSQAFSKEQQVFLMHAFNSMEKRLFTRMDEKFNEMTFAFSETVIRSIDERFEKYFTPLNADIHVLRLRIDIICNCRCRSRKSNLS